MPVLTGLQVVEQLRKHGRDDLVVGITANAQREDQDEFLAAGVNQCGGVPSAHVSSARLTYCPLTRQRAHQARARQQPQNYARACSAATHSKVGITTIGFFVGLEDSIDSYIEDGLYVICTKDRACCLRGRRFGACVALVALAWECRTLMSGQLHLRSFAKLVLCLPVGGGLPCRTDFSLDRRPSPRRVASDFRLAAAPAHIVAHHGACSRVRGAAFEVVR